MMVFNDFGIWGKSPSANTSPMNASEQAIKRTSTPSAFIDVPSQGKNRFLIHLYKARLFNKILIVPVTQIRSNPDAIACAGQILF